jgi:signal transduction histidine kinase/DNA-binding response OmpR family regulator/CHASE3 domain sensor protein
MIILLGLVSVIGIYTYQQFSSIVKSISNDANSDSILVTSKSLLNYIGDAENSVKSFSLTKDTIYLERFYESADKVDVELLKFENLSKETSLPRYYLDSLDSLINKKFDLLDDLLFLQDQFRVEAALNKVANKLDKIRRGYKEENEVSVEKANEIAEHKNAESGKIKLFGFLRRKSKKKKAEQEAIARYNDSIIEAKKLNKDIQFSKINKEVEEVKKEEKSIESLLKNQELELIIADKGITKKIKKYLFLTEEHELLVLAEKTKKARAIMKSTNIQIAVFCIIAGGLILLMFYVIINYVRSNNKYRKALKVAKRKAEDFAFTKEKFIANMTHEIRTPMNTIAGFTEQLAKGPLTFNQNEQLKMVRKSVDHLLYVINDVLDYSKLQSGKLNLECVGFRLKPLTDDIVAITKPLIREKKLTIHCEFNVDEDLLIIGDPYRLRQILLNLISNAIKFTNDGSVTLKVGSLSKEDDNYRLIFEVTDTGIGMSDSQLGKVFEEFEQAEDNITRNYGGTGLGLSIVSVLVDLHKGKINVASKPNGGTSVGVEIPYLKGGINDLEEDFIEGKAINYDFLKGLNILIVDDTFYNRKLLITILKKYKVSYTEATTGQEAIDSVKNKQYDLILMDARMPDVNGLEATIKIREMKISTPVIALTAAVTKEDQVSYRKAGMNGFLAKPFKEQDLLEEINLVLNNSSKFIKSTVYKSEDEDEEVEVDFTELKDLSSGDEVFYKDMLETFLETSTESLESMISASEVKSWEMVAEFAHKACSPCKHLSANKLYQTLKTIELNCRNNKELENIPHQIKVADCEFKNVAEIVRKELESLK